MSALSQLRTQRRFLADPNHTYVNRCPNFPGEACAILRVTARNSSYGFGPVACALLSEVVGGRRGDSFPSSIIAWNDGWRGMTKPTREEVIVKLDEAIALAKERGL